MSWYKYFKRGDIDLKKMEDFFYERTNNHINLVKKYCKKIYDYDKKRFDGIIERGEEHDQSKFLEPEKESYVYISWQYKCRDEGSDFEFPETLKNRTNKATQHHVINNRHHPEFFSVKKDNLINRDDRDNPSKEIIDAVKMTDLDIAEMCADWLAMSEEKGTNPKDWADKNVNIKWKFNDNQIDLIYKLINNT